MKNYLYFSLFFFIAVLTSNAQITLNKTINDLLPQIALVEMGTITLKDSTLNSKDTPIHLKKEFIKYLDFLKQIENLKKLKGSIEFGFNGNEVDNTNLYTINTGMQANFGGYPLEVEATTNIQTQITDGKFEENLSSLDISMDYHLFNSLTHETYVFVKRTKNKFLGIDQRYEIGGGYVLNFYSGKSENGRVKSTTEKGKKFLKQLYKYEKLYSQLTTTDTLVKDVIKSKLSSSLKKEKKDINNTNFDTIFNSRTEQEKSIIKSYSKHRVALLLGFNYEIEKTRDSLSLYNKELDSTFNKTFEATSLFRLVVAPKYTLKGDKFKWSNTVFFKIGLLNLVDDVVLPDEDISNQLVRDERADYWIDLSTSFEFEISEYLSFVSTINYVYDNAPKRIFFDNDNLIPQIAEAESRFTGINFKLKYKF